MKNNDRKLCVFLIQKLFNKIKFFDIFFNILPHILISSYLILSMWTHRSL